MNPNAESAAFVEVVTSCGVVLADGSSVIIGVRLLYNNVAQGPAIINETISKFFYSDGAGIRLTLSQLRTDPVHIANLCDRLKGLLNVHSAAVAGMTVSSPPIEAIEDRSREITAVLVTGETVMLKIGTPEGISRPSTAVAKQVFDFLSKQKLVDLKNIDEKLNQAILPVNTGWKYLILGLEILACPCK